MLNEDDQESVALKSSAHELETLQSEASAHITLARVYAATTSNRFQDKEKALEHARKAALISKACDALIFSTLGWTYFINGKVKEAIEAAEASVALSPENDRFKEQLASYRKTGV